MNGIGGKWHDSEKQRVAPKRRQRAMKAFAAPSMAECTGGWFRLGNGVGIDLTMAVKRSDRLKDSYARLKLSFAKSCDWELS